MDAYCAMQLQTKATKEENHSPTHEDSSTEHQQQWLFCLQPGIIEYKEI